mgnify:CR=1 FL=1
MNSTRAPPPPSPISKSYSKNNTTIPKRIDQLSCIHFEAMELFKRKNQDYGDAFANYGTIGVLVRMGDKISRMQSITTNQISLVNTEALRDTLIDLHNYAAMAIMILDNDPSDFSSPPLLTNNSRDSISSTEQPDMACSEYSGDFMKSNKNNDNKSIAPSPSILPLPPKYMLKKPNQEPYLNDPEDKLHIDNAIWP